MSSIRLALIDDQKLFRQSLAALLAGFSAFELVAEAENGNDFLQQMERAAALPHIVLMDMEMPGMDGMELQELLQKRYPSIKIIVLSVHARERLIARMIEAGSSGYLVKDCDKEELATAIHSVATSGFYINGQVLKALQSAAGQKGKSMRNINNIPIEISVREREVLQLICQEYSNSEMAGRLHISIRTVEGHRNNLLSKTGCRNTAGLVLFAIKYNIYELV